MKATLAKEYTSNARNYGGEKELSCSWNAVCKDDNGTIHEPVTVRCYMGRSRNASRVYASVWVHNHPISLSGTGWAGGYGYDKKSAAVQDAMTKAEIELSEPIDGRGASMIEEAIKAITVALGFDNCYIVRN